MRTKLSKLKPGQKGRILEVEGHQIQIALARLGVLPGDVFVLANVAPLGDPIAISINGTKVFLRKKDAATVWIDLLS
jgi:ferrous iron transport protein A